MSLVLFTSDGDILVANGRGGYSSIRKQSSAEILADFDTFAEWVRAGKTREEAEKIAEDPDEYTSGSYYLPEGARWDDLMAVGENRAEAIDKALHAIEEHNAQYLEGVLAGVRFNDERRFGDVQPAGSGFHPQRLIRPTCAFNHSPSIFSIRRSGTSQMAAASHRMHMPMIGPRNAEPIATA